VLPHCVNTTLGQFFEELGSPRTAGGPTVELTSDDLQKFVRISVKYRYGLASPAENAAVGLAVP
jgi:hypothetical protein